MLNNMKIKKEDVIETVVNVVIICVAGMLIYFVSKIGYSIFKTILEL